MKCPAHTAKPGKVCPTCSFICDTCEDSGFSGVGTGYGDVCDDCGGQSAAVSRRRYEHRPWRQIVESTHFPTPAMQVEAEQACAGAFGGTVEDLYEEGGMRFAAPALRNPRIGLAAWYSLVAGCAEHEVQKLLDEHDPVLQSHGAIRSFKAGVGR